MFKSFFSKMYNKKLIDPLKLYKFIKKVVQVLIKSKIRKVFGTEMSILLLAIYYNYNNNT